VRARVAHIARLNLALSRPILVSVTRRYLIALAVLAAGCEQLKSPQRIRDLEGRVDDLTKQVATLSGKPAPAKPGDRAAAGAPAGGEVKPGASGPGEHEGGRAATVEHPGEHEGSGRTAASGGDDHAAKPGEGSDRAASPAHPASAHDDGHPPADAGVPDAAGHGDPAMERLLSVVAKSTGGKPEVKHKPHWAYDGKQGPPVWGMLDPEWNTCSAGKAQSPVDIEPRASAASPITFHYKPTAATVVDNGHTLQVSLSPGSSIEIDGRSYDLVQFHFHTPSEHAIAGEHYPLEIHLVHKDADGKLAVIGVLVDTGAESGMLAGLWSQWPKKAETEAKLRKPFDPSVLLPENRKVFRYSGSLTTPPCTEGVVWNVMRRTLSDSKRHLDAFTQHYQLNARELQPLNDRKVE